MGFATSPVAWGGLVIAAYCISSVYSRYQARKRYAALNAGPPAVVSTPIFGLDIAIDMFRAVNKLQFHLWTQKLLEKHKHTMELRMLGETLVMTDDPENIQSIQETQFWDFAKSEEQHEIFKHILGDAIFAMNGEEWKTEAALYRAHMGRIRSTDLPVTEKHILSAFSLFAQDGCEATDVIDRLQLDIVTEIFCGESTDSLISDRSPFRNAMETLQKINSLRLLLGKVGVLMDVKYFAPRAVKFIDDYQDAMTNKAFSRSGDVSASGSICLIDDMIARGKNRHDIKNAVSSILLAGKDPSATTLAFAFYEVAKRPEVFARMQAEVQEHIGFERLPSIADLQKLKFIRMVIKETLRHHHPLGYNARVPIKDIVLPRGGGPDGKDPAVVFKGTQILYGLLSLQHRTDLGVDDVNEWRPERWETWKPESQWEYVPFNHGPRICPGQVFANFQMEYFFARLCQQFESIFLLPHSQSQEGLMRLELNTKMAHPVYAKCVERKL
ncbi:hypothetical protein S7711_05784 [Stachybotrys chartarum IBT 7711]|uniref:Cytochrome P450 n=1 Tax=Stachybotrys chartarum (strain CBS 109288 / IBT 7711) TaxID=1280523 RepID=A0A084ATH3_STACB|nr:hypothetical protein S7711_05784 [Stachybotrys chartarum IBT 7711]